MACRERIRSLQKARGPVSDRGRTCLEESNGAFLMHHHLKTSQWFLLKKRIHVSKDGKNQVEEQEGLQGRVP